MTDEGKGAAPRIAIKFGASSASAGAKKQARSNPPSSLGKRPRPHNSNNAWGGGSDSENESDDEHRGRHEKITGFGAEGAETERKRRDTTNEKRDYVIARQPNRDWKSEARGQRRGRGPAPEEARAQTDGGAVETEPADQEKGLQWGLTVQQRPVENSDAAEGEARPPAEEEAPAPAPRTADDEAIDALLGNRPQDQRVIAASETDAYQRDVERAGEASTLDDYEAMPVEEFGAALLRGMGWDGKPRGPGVKEVKRRPNRLGLGAKELKEAEDLGGWNQGKKSGGGPGGSRRPRLDEYRREEGRRKEGRRHEDSYKRERERERERDRDRHSHRDRDRDHDRHRDRQSRPRDYDRHRR